jgi:hypothetical protein
VGRGQYQNKNVKDLDLNNPNLNLYNIQNWTFEVIEDRKKLINDKIIEYFHSQTLRITN